MEKKLKRKWYAQGKTVILQDNNRAIVLVNNIKASISKRENRFLWNIVTKEGNFH